jgi:hypothetical protein
VLVAFRYRPLGLWRRIGESPDGSAPTQRSGLGLRSWVERFAFVAVPALPGLAWAALVHVFRIPNRFFGPPSGETVSYRARTAVGSMANHLVVLPVAFGVLLLGTIFLRGYRQRLGLGNPSWLWTTVIAYLALLIATYAVGSYPIHWWLATSVDRTTIFPQAALYADVGVWLAVSLVAGEPARRSTRAEESGVARPENGVRAGDAGDGDRSDEATAPPTARL